MGPMFDPVFAYLVFRRSLEVDWECKCPAIEETLKHYEWNTREDLGLPDQRVHERKRDASGEIVYAECRLAPVAVKYKVGI